MDTKTEELIKRLRALLIEEEPETGVPRMIKLLEEYGLSKNQMRAFAKRVLERLPPEDSG